MDNCYQELFRDRLFDLKMSQFEEEDDHSDKPNDWLTYGSQFADACRVPYPLEQVI